MESFPRTEQRTKSYFVPSNDPTSDLALDFCFVSKVADGYEEAMVQAPDWKQILFFKN